MSTLFVELNKAIRCLSFRLSLGIALALSLAQAAVPISKVIRPGYYDLDPTEWLGMSQDGSYCIWIGVGVLDDTPLRLVFFSLIPLLSTFAYASTFCSEIRTGHATQIASRGGWSSYLGAKLAAVFVTSALVAFLPLAINFATVSCFAPAYTPDINEVLYIGLTAGQLWSRLFYTHPLAYVAMSSMLDALLCGLWSALVCLFGYWVDNRVVLVSASYGFLLLVQYVNNSVVFSLLGRSGFCFNLIGSLFSVGGGYERYAIGIIAQLIAMLTLICVLTIFVSRRGESR